MITQRTLGSFSLVAPTLIMGCGSGASQGTAAVTATLESPRDAAPEPLREFLEPDDADPAFKARCGLHVLGICQMPDVNGTMELCGAGLWPSVGEHYLLHDEHLVLADIGPVTIKAVTADVGQSGFRATGEVAAGWSDADYSPIGAVGPWNEHLGLSGGRFLWGEMADELGVWRVGFTLAFSGGQRFELREKLETCEVLITETRFLQSGRQCITDSVTSPPHVFIRLPRKCALTKGAGPVQGP